MCDYDSAPYEEKDIIFSEVIQKNIENPPNELKVESKLILDCVWCTVDESHRFQLNPWIFR